MRTVNHNQQQQNFRRISWIQVSYVNDLVPFMSTVNHNQHQLNFGTIIEVQVYSVNVSVLFMPTGNPLDLPLSHQHLPINNIAEEAALLLCLFILGKNAKLAWFANPTRCSDCPCDLFTVMAKHECVSSVDTNHRYCHQEMRQFWSMIYCDPLHCPLCWSKFQSSIGHHSYF